VTRSDEERLISGYAQIMACHEAMARSVYIHLELVRANLLSALAVAPFLRETTSMPPDRSHSNPPA
jgi:hypothetical protein